MVSRVLGSRVPIENLSVT